jgi:hypothetical protein
LCENYIGEILTRGHKDHGNKDLSHDDVEKKDGKEFIDQIQSKLNENYYLEDDRKLLNILIKNCYPIISDLLTQIDNFNTYNQVFDSEKVKQMRLTKFEIQQIVTEAD